MSQDRLPTKKAWVPPQIWSSRAYILGGGPSLSKIDVDRLRGQNVIAVNNAYKLGDWIPFVYFGDRAWFNWHEEEVLKHPGILVTACPDLWKTQAQGVKWMERGARGVYDSRPGYMTYGHSSGHAAICLAVDLGAKEVVLFGFDMHARHGHNWHNEHRREVPSSIYSSNFYKPMQKLAVSLKDMGISVLNATPGSALDLFPIVDPEEVLP